MPAIEMAGGDSNRTLRTNSIEETINDCVRTALHIPILLRELWKKTVSPEPMPSPLRPSIMSDLVTRVLPSGVYGGLGKVEVLKIVRSPASFVQCGDWRAKP